MAVDQLILDELEALDRKDRQLQYIQLQDLIKENEKLRNLVVCMAERIFTQSELLTKKATKKGIGE